MATKSTGRKSTTAKVDKVASEATDIKVENNVDNSVDIQKMIQDAVQQALSSVTAVHEEEKKKLLQEVEELKSSVKEEPTKKKSRQFSSVPADTIIEIRNNIGGKFIIEENKGRVPVFRTLDGYGETTELTYEELRSYWGNNHKFFDTGVLSIVAVHSMEVTFDDVIHSLRLGNIYNEEMPLDDIESIFNKEYDDFVRILNKYDKIAYAILNVAMNMYKESRFSDISKINYMKQKFEMPQLFS